jgi:hypothetical protein
MEAGGGTTGDQGSQRRRLNERAWRDVFKRFDGAGLTVEAFCKAEGLSRSSFNRWRSQLPMRADATAAATAGSFDARQSAASFVDLGLLGAAATAAPAGPQSRLELGGGLSLTLMRR